MFVLRVQRLVLESTFVSASNPKLDPKFSELRGIVHLFRSVSHVSLPNPNPSSRSTLLFVVAVPNYLSDDDFIRFCGTHIDNVSELLFIRNDGMEDRYCVLIKLVDQSSADGFYGKFNGVRFSPGEAQVCHILFLLDVEYTESAEIAGEAPVGFTELPTCPICLERLDPDTSGILSTLCDHSFQCSCVSKWTYLSCQVCRFCQQQDEKPTCFNCGTLEKLWVCMMCGFVGCGRYKKGHAIGHWKDTQHCYSIDPKTQQIWDYVGHNYVHRLNQSKVDGKLAEMNSSCMSHEGKCGTCGCSQDSSISSTLYSSKVEVIVDEYNSLLATQLETQRQYYESLLSEAKNKIESTVSEAVEKAINSKMLEIQTEFEKCSDEKRIVAEINPNLIKNKGILREKCKEIEERGIRALSGPAMTNKRVAESAATEEDPVQRLGLSVDVLVKRFDNFEGVAEAHFLGLESSNQRMEQYFMTIAQHIPSLRQGGESSSVQGQRVENLGNTPPPALGSIMSNFQDQNVHQTPQKVRDWNPEEQTRRSGTQRRLVIPEQEREENMGQNNEEMNRFPRFKVPTVPFPSFDGTDVRGWIQNCLGYFYYCEIPEEQKTRFASGHFTGLARLWFNQYKLGKGVIPWEIFCRDIAWKFDKQGHDDIVIEFDHLEQKGTVQELEFQFEELKSLLVFRLPVFLEESYWVSSFIGKLRPQLRPGVQVLGPPNLYQAMFMARHEEQRMIQLLGPQYYRQPAIYKPKPEIKPHYVPKASPNMNNIRKINAADIEELRSKRLCFKCKGKWFKGHDCPNKHIQLMMIQEEDSDVEEEFVDSEAGPKNELSEAPTLPEVTLCMV